MNDTSISTEVMKYETYINEVLKSDLNRICRQLDEVNTDLAEYQALQKTINLLGELKDTNQVYKTMMDIGCNFFMETRVEDLSHISLDIGQGCYLELTLNEALKFLRSKLDFLTSKQGLLSEKSAKIKAHIKLMLLYVNQLNESHNK